MGDPPRYLGDLHDAVDGPAAAGDGQQATVPVAELVHRADATGIEILQGTQIEQDGLTVRADPG